MSDLTSPSAYVEGSRAFIVTADDHSGIAIIVTTLLMVWTILCFLIRLYTRLSQRASIGPDDFVCGITTVLATVQTIVACVSVSHGFGKSESLITAEQLSYILKTQYAVTLLCLCTIFLTKIDMVLFHSRITPRKDQTVACHILLGVVACSGVAAIIADAVRCNGKQPWDLSKHHCANYVSIWTFVTVMDVLTEIAIFAMPCWILWSLQLPIRKKMIVLLSFALRLPLIVVSVAHVVYISTWRSADVPFVAAVNAFIQLQVETHFAAMATTIPSLGTFMKNLNTRWGALDAQGISASYALKSVPMANSGASGSGHGKHSQKLSPVDGGGVERYSWRMRTPDEQRRSGFAEGSDQMIIRKTVQMSVEHHG